ncbi:uncharacterized protein PG998_010366 [Apiospora kogelbergensis]|uniref:uncharacterized protein n=1 Tax=Apiospora kogelbergensis TaxID=1337665 RepID=UPI0031328332
MSTLVAIARLQQDLAGMEKALDGLSPEDGLQSLDEESRSDIPSVQVDYQVFQAFIKTGKIIIVGNRSPGPIQSATTGHTETAKHKATEFPAAPFQTSDRGGTKNDIFSSKQPLSSPAALSDFQVSERIEPAATSLPNAKLLFPRALQAVERQPEEERNEKDLIKTTELLINGGKIVTEGNGVINSLGPDGRIAGNVYILPSYFLL